MTNPLLFYNGFCLVSILLHNGSNTRARSAYSSAQQTNLNVGGMMEKSNPSASDFHPNVSRVFQTGMQRYIDRGKYAGMVSLVARQGKIAHFDTVGLMNIAQESPCRWMRSSVSTR
jgi:hypothetical protein